VISLLDETETKYVSEHCKNHRSKEGKSEDRSKMLIFSNFEDLMGQSKLKDIKHEPAFSTVRPKLMRLPNHHKEPSFVHETKEVMVRSSSLPTIVGLSVKDLPKR